MIAPGLNGLLELLYPPTARCAACGKKLTRADDPLLCGSCADGLLVIPANTPCPHCGRPESARGCLACLRAVAPSLASATAAYQHLGTPRELVHALKYDLRRPAAIPLAEGMAEALWEQRGEWDLLVPIPLHRRKLRERCFNQAMALAEELGARTGLPAREALRRTVDTAQQATLHAASRLENVRGAFEPATPMAGLRVLLIDDVRTTGATAEAAALACKQARAQRVGLLTATCAS